MDPINKFLWTMLTLLIMCRIQPDLNINIKHSVEVNGRVDHVHRWEASDTLPSAWTVRDMTRNK